MYTDFYGLREKPFSLTPNPRYLYLSESHREALAHLLYGIEQGEGFIAITGEVGTGKTTICRTLIERLGAESEVAFLFNPSRSAEELLEAIASEFGLPARKRSRSELHDDLNRFLLDKKEEGKRVLLIIDESQNLSPDTLEQVRLLSNLETSTSKLIQILLLGQPELDRMLDSPALRQLRQRISVRWRLSPLAQRETCDYVTHRLGVAAGASRDVFTPAALREIHRRTGGVPRRINVLADRTLLAGYAAEAHRIEAKLVRRVAAEMPDTAEPAAPRRRKRAGSGVLARLGLMAGAALAAFAGGVAAVAIFASEPLQQRLATRVGESAAALPLPIDVASAPPQAEAVAPAALDVAAAPVFVEAPEEPAVRPGFLLFALERRDPALVRSAAVDSILSGYGLPPLGRSTDDVDDAIAALRERGLRVLSLEGADLAALRTLNHPVLLSLWAGGEERLVALRSLDDEQAELAGLDESEPLQVSVDQLLERWDGGAYVLWRQFEPAPEVMMLGDQGLAVLWLQTSLAELGYYPRTPSGRFDRTTRDSVRALQRRHRLEPDGAAGPRTQMVLYDLLDRYAFPRLTERGHAG